MEEKEGNKFYYEGEYAVNATEENKYNYRHGRGVILKHSKDKIASWMYEGYVHYGKRHGYGREICHTGKVYVGQWIFDQKEGLGKQVFVNGSYYEGVFKENKWHGQGKHVQADGTKQTGLW